MNKDSNLYMILNHVSMELLEDEVNNALGYGWKLKNGPFIRDGKWFQCVYRYVEGVK